MRYFRAVLLVGLTLVLAACLRQYTGTPTQVGMYEFQGTKYRVAKRSYTLNGETGSVLLLYRDDGTDLAKATPLASCEGTSTYAECEKAFGAQLNEMMSGSSGY